MTKDHSEGLTEEELRERYNYVVRFVHGLPAELRDLGYDDASKVLQDYLDECYAEATMQGR